MTTARTSQTTRASASCCPRLGDPFTWSARGTLCPWCHTGITSRSRVVRLLRPVPVEAVRRDPIAWGSSRDWVSPRTGLAFYASGDRPRLRWARYAHERCWEADQRRCHGRGRGADAAATGVGAA